MSQFKTVIAEIADAFETFKRDGSDEECYKIKEDAPEWLKGFSFMREIHSAVDDRGPDDWIYEHTARIARTMTEYSAETADEMRENAHEIADGMVDVYTMERYHWLARHLLNGSLCDEAQESGVVDEKASIADRIACGQYLALERIFNALLEAAESEAESREDAEE